MKKFTPFLFLCCLMLCGQFAQAQVYSDHFDNDDPAFMGGSGSYTFAESGTELTISASNTGPFDVFTYQLHDAATNTQVTVDASGNNKVFMRAKASNVGTQIRVDAQDAAGYLTSLPSITKTLTTEYTVLEFDFGGQYVDAGYGGTPCMTGPCVVDSSMISALVMYTNPGAGGFNGTVVIDYISFGAPPDTVITSDVFQDHFADTSSIGAFTFVGAGYSLSQSGTEVSISGDGTTPMWDPLAYVFINPTTLDTVDIDITGNNKLYVKVKSSVAGTALRLDMQDIDGFASTQGSITKIVDTAYTVLEYDYNGVLNDLGYGGTPCTQSTAPCPVDGSRIGNIVMFIEPGVGAFTGTLTIDYISFGVSLEPLGPEPDLIYEDHFNNDMLDFTSVDPGFTVAESGSELTVTGDGTAAPFVALSYVLHDKDSGQQIFLNMAPAANKVYIRAKVDSGMVPLRMDLVDTAEFHTTQPSLTKAISDEYAIYEYNFTGLYTDAGYGGTSCATGPCPVDPGSIKQILLYIDPIQGGFDGVVTIDFISIGQPLGEDAGPVGIVNYSDQMDDNTSLFISDGSGFSSTTMNDEWTISGDGTSGAYTPIVYSTHNDLGELIMANSVGSNDQLFVRAKASVDSTILRIDLQDNVGYVTNLNAQSVYLGTEYEVFELNYATAYQDGAYGGTPCMVQGCLVDGLRIEGLQFFVNPDDGAYDGTVTIDWISFGASIVGIEAPELLQTLRAYPNPAEDRIRVEYTLQQSSSVELRVSNMMGQQVIGQVTQQATGLHQVDLNLQELPQGMYFLQILTDNELAGTLRLLKK